MFKLNFIYSQEWMCVFDVNKSLLKAPAPRRKTIIDETKRYFMYLYSLIFFNVQGGACQFLIDNDKVDHYI